MSHADKPGIPTRYRKPHPSEDIVVPPEPPAVQHVQSAQPVQQMAPLPLLPPLPEKTSVSFIPAAISEAKKTTVSVSLLLIVAFVVGAFYAGRSSPSPEMVAEQATQNERISTNLTEMVAAQKKTAELLDKIAQGQAVHTELARTTNTEVQFMSSHYKSAKVP